MSIVFTNGCFDIFHIGHVHLLKKCATYGDYLIVGLNSDESIKRLKGPSRPINNEEDRKYILEALSCVHRVIIFNENDPYRLISLLKPNVLIKGGDWPLEKIIGADIVQSYGGKVVSVPLYKNYSTTRIIEKIKEGP